VSVVLGSTTVNEVCSVDVVNASASVSVNRSPAFSGLHFTAADPPQRATTTSPRQPGAGKPPLHYETADRSRLTQLHRGHVLTSSWNLDQALLQSSRPHSSSDLHCCFGVQRCHRQASLLLSPRHETLYL